MKRLVTILIAVVLLPLAVVASPVDDENAKLKVQIEQLKAQLQAAQSSCATSATPVPATTAATTPPAPAAILAPSPAVVAATPEAAAPPPKAVEKAEVPSGYKLVKIEPAIPKDDRWKDAAAWDALVKGMGKQEVENLLGLEHSVTEGGNRTFWGYGKIGVLYSGTVIFVNDRLAVWTKPDF